MRWLNGITFILYAAGAVMGIALVLLPARKRLRMTLPPKLPVVLGWLLHTAYLIAYGVQHGRHPFGTSHEMLSFLVWAAVLVYLIADTFRPVKAFSAFFMPVVALLSAGSMYLELGGETPAAKGVWVKLHGTFALLGLGAFALAAAAAIMYLIQERQLKSKHAGKLFAALPSLNLLDRLNRLFVGGGFVLFSISLFSGAALARALKTADELRSGWLLVGASVTGWAVFGIVLYCRLTGRFRGRKVAWLTLAGFAAIVAALVLIFASTENIHAVGGT